MRSVLIITVLMAAPAERIPFVPGLTVISVGSAPVGDYEVLRTLDSVNEKGYRLVTTGDVPADDGDGLIPLSLARRVRAADQLHSRNVRLTWHSSDRENMSGNVPGLSCDVIAELRSTGKSQLTYLFVVPVAGMAITTNKLQGVVSVVDRKPYSVLVNRTRVALPALHLSGTLTDGERSKVFDLQVSDDPDNPLVLHAQMGENELRVASIEFPLTRDTLERKLATADSVELSGIYFQFGSATLRTESDALLSQLAGVLKAHPDWQFRLDGYTDSIGTSAANQELSARRSAAVRTALIERFGVSAGQLTTRGLGETQPRESNDSDSGRARNRRVELVRVNPKTKPLASSQQAAAPATPSGSACRF